MTDYFALLDLPRSPWLESAEVKARFTRLSGPVHPDRVHQADDATRVAATQRYAELNSAQQCLGGTRQRLRHLIELVSGQPPSDVGAVPPHISELFFKVGQSLRTADQLVRQKRVATSPMAKALIMRQVLEGMAPLQEVIRELELQQGVLDDRCRSLGGNWEATGGSVAPLLALHRDYSYVNRWLEQLRERQLELTL